ncbi:MAG: hypothetical protein FWF85_00310 [Clostridiales bacterium]|nr:hypothetical protein [Clostridiales bacterium]
MKKLLLIALLSITAALLGACAPDILPLTEEAAADDNILEIKERMFIQQCSDIMINPELYLEKTIRLEGIYDIIIEDEEVYQCIYRRGPGCCPGVDSEYGFICYYDGEKPNENDWVRATGTIILEKYENGRQQVILNLSKLEVLDERGQETVDN